MGEGWEGLGRRGEEREGYKGVRDGFDGEMDERVYGEIDRDRDRDR